MPGVNPRAPRSLKTACSLATKGNLELFFQIFLFQKKRVIHVSLMQNTKISKAKVSSELHAIFMFLPL